MKIINIYYKQTKLNNSFQKIILIVEKYVEQINEEYSNGSKQVSKKNVI